MANMGGADSRIPIHPLSSSSLCLLLPLEDKQNPKRALEDYLDPALLRTISSRIGLKETKEKKDVVVSSIQRTEFDWPVDRLDPLINNPNRDSGREYGGSRFFPPAIPSLSKRRRSDFPIWKVTDNKHGAG
ncbi:hypothetical protein F2Q68_00037840 [Brassica cretica]|uniref:Uncharacterized protein n=2 Tax=Brassica cretica TaxID=69181 RepID=A0A3N6S307_BRACR|nr:hypothetical protein F2Q68_00037840 [Brassica cretica]KAF3591387.1 hypothetical protein DY000_02027909 [Brassica cretica]